MKNQIPQNNFLCNSVNDILSDKNNYRKKLHDSNKMIVDDTAEYTPLRLWLNGKNFDEDIIDFKISIENDLEQLSHLLEIDLVIMSISPKNKLLSSNVDVI